jgi:hypothetical protein
MQEAQAQYQQEEEAPEASPTKHMVDIDGDSIDMSSFYVQTTQDNELDNGSPSYNLELDISNQMKMEKKIRIENYLDTLV